MALRRSVEAMITAVLLLVVLSLLFSSLTLDFQTSTNISQTFFFLLMVAVILSFFSAFFKILSKLF